MVRNDQDWSGIIRTGQEGSREVRNGQIWSRIIGIGHE